MARSRGPTSPPKAAPGPKVKYRNKTVRSTFNWTERTERRTTAAQERAQWKRSDVIEHCMTTRDSVDDITAETVPGQTTWK